MQITRSQLGVKGAQRNRSIFNAKMVTNCMFTKNYIERGQGIEFDEGMDPSNTVENNKEIY